MLELNLIHLGHVLDLLKKIPDESISMVVTSPPYWGLRDYGVDGQIGLENTPEEYVAVIVEIFEEIKRVLRPWGTIWLNLGDSYAGSGQGDNADGSIGKTASKKQKGNKGAQFSKSKRIPRGSGRWGGGNMPATGNLKPKDLVGIPWMVAFALRNAGWYLRSDIIWHKSNPMPESVTDRPTKSHEYIFLLSKNRKYFYDADAIREPAKDWGDRDRTNWSKRIDAEQMGQSPHRGGEKGNFLATGRNKRSVWEVATQPFPDAHFATFPTKLIEPCILAGCPQEVCVKCGKPRERIIDKKSNYKKREKAYVPGNTATKVDSTGWKPPTITEHGFTNCGCGKGFEPGVVLDPFMGAGTTAIVARRHDRNYIGIELKQEYIDIAYKRMRKELGIFSLTP